MVETLDPLILLYTGGSTSVEGATRFQKLIFLAQMEHDLGEHYRYREDNFGPFAPTLAADLSQLERRGYIEMNKVQNEVGNEKHIYGLTNKGIRTAQRMVKKGYREESFERLQEVKNRFNGWSLDKLIEYVYQHYPEFTTKTQLDVDQLFDPDVESQFLEPDMDFLGPGPQESLAMNSSAGDIFSLD